MRELTMKILSAISIAAMVAASVWAWSAAPQITEIAVHWNLSGEAVAFRSKEVALSLAPVTAALLSVALAFATGSAPAGDQWAKRVRAAWFAALLAAALVHVFIVLAAAGMVTKFGNYTALPPAVFAGVAGNYMAKGGRAWQRRAGRFLVATSFATFATWLLVPGPAAEFVVVIGALVGFLVSSLLGDRANGTASSNGA